MKFRGIFIRSVYANDSNDLKQDALAIQSASGVF